MACKNPNCPAYKLNIIEIQQRDEHKNIGLRFIPYDEKTYDFEKEAKMMACFIMDNLPTTTLLYLIELMFRLLINRTIKSFLGRV